ncbi:unnamed protein product [Strongylus vulgaris]|uniref:Uncharacterized protein n=1 Tax=Strongylus vulgaris TaxID=40348 RepID=A0A3P7K1K3_STRVU|nr:unnamed protein product [Strongylus vulgaris]
MIGMEEGVNTILEGGRDERSIVTVGPIVPEDGTGMTISIVADGMATEDGMDTMEIDMTAGILYVQEVQTIGAGIPEVVTIFIVQVSEADMKVGILFVEETTGIPEAILVIQVSEAE